MTFINFVYFSFKKLFMATVIIYNNDIQGALRALKKEQQKEGTFRYIKGRKTYKNNHEKNKERLTEIIRRKIKDKHEKAANGAYMGVDVQNPKPFVFKISGYIAKVFNNGKVFIYTNKNKKVNEVMLNKADFDDIEALLGKVKASVEE